MPAGRTEPKLYGESAPVRLLKRRIRQVAPTPLPVVLVGETGTGKEVAARYVHHHSGRAGPFVAVDCGALSPSLIEAELFGHERGAFTGANQRRDGLAAAADGGTFFLDEIAELPLDTQTRLLRLVQEGTFRPLGAGSERRADIRIVAATWKDLEAEVRRGRFRRDLYHRLAVVELRLPSLRERGDDLDLLLDRFVEDTCARIGRSVPTIDGDVRAHLRRWPWPGNVRELLNAVEYACAMARGPRIDMQDLPPQLRRGHPDAPRLTGPGAPDVRIDLPYMEARRMWLDAFQDLYVHRLLEVHDGNVSAAARAARMDRRSIQRILARMRDELDDDAT